MIKAGVSLPMVADNRMNRVSKLVMEKISRDRSRSFGGEPNWKNVNLAAISEHEAYFRNQSLSKRRVISGAKARLS